MAAASWGVGPIVQMGRHIGQPLATHKIYPVKCMASAGKGKIVDSTNAPTDAALISRWLPSVRNRRAHALIYDNDNAPARRREEEKQNDNESVNHKHSPI